MTSQHSHLPPLPCSHRSIPHLKNLKCHFRLPPPLAPFSENLLTTTLQSALEICPALKWKKHGNFVVLRIGKLVFTAFLRSNFVNVTGLKSESEIEPAINLFKSLLGIPLESEISVKQDNCTWSGNLEKCFAPRKFIDLHKLKLDLEKEGKFKVSLRPHFFPAAVIRGEGGRGERGGSLLLFRKGQFIIVGCTKKALAYQRVNQVCASIAKQ